MGRCYIQPIIYLKYIMRPESRLSADGYTHSFNKDIETDDLRIHPRLYR